MEIALRIHVRGYLRM